MNKRSGLALPVLILFSLVACTSGPAVEELRRDPAYELVEPGSVEIGLVEWGSGPSWTPTGQNDAHTEKLWGSSSTMDEILAFYQVELPKEGWEEQEPRFGAAACVDPGQVANWRKGDLRLFVGFLDEESQAVQDEDGLCPDTLPEGAFDQYHTLYQVRLGYMPDR